MQLEADLAQLVQWPPGPTIHMQRCTDVQRSLKNMFYLFKECTMNIKQPPEVHIATRLKSALQSLLYAALCGMLMTI